MKRFLAILTTLGLIMTGALMLPQRAQSAALPLFSGPNCSEASQLLSCLNQLIAGINGALGTYANDPASSTYYPAYTFTNSQTLLAFNASGTTTTYAYVTLPAMPIDGQQACIYARAAITTLYLYGAGTQTVNNAVTALGAAGKVCYTYSLANTTWYRSQ